MERNSRKERVGIVVSDKMDSKQVQAPALQKDGVYNQKI